MAKPYCCKEAQAAPLHERGPAALSDKNNLLLKSTCETFIETTKDDLRHHFAQTPLGMLDAYQLLLFLNAHTMRHIAQIKELTARPEFPKS